MTRFQTGLNNIVQLVSFKLSTKRPVSLVLIGFCFVLLSRVIAAILLGIAQVAPTILLANSILLFVAAGINLISQFRK